MNDVNQEALKKALQRLEVSDRFEAEVRKALIRYPVETVDQVVAYLKEKRLLNDERTLRYTLQGNQGRRAVGAELLRHRLERRGAAEELICDAVAETRENEANMVGALLQGRFRKPGDDDSVKERLAIRAKAARFLFGRGFGEEVIESALERHFGTLESPE